MFRLFKQKSPTIDELHIPTFDFIEKESSKNTKEWLNKEQNILLSVNFIEEQPDLPSTKFEEYLQKYYREMIAKNNGGLVNLSLLEMNGIPSVKVILKLPQATRGMIYLGSITIPFKNNSFVIKIQANEIATTGIRESIITNQLLTSGEISIGNDGYEGWFEDPYDVNFKGGTLMNKSEKECYDMQFPDHPLSILRSMLLQIESECNLSNRLIKQEKFEY